MTQLAKPGRRVRGYRIHVFRGSGSHPCSYTTPLMWRESVPLAEWHAILADPTTHHAWIIQSGRKMAAYQFRRDDPGAPSTRLRTRPPPTNGTFPLSCALAGRPKLQE